MGAVQRRFDQFTANPASIRNAVAAIVSFTVMAVLLGAVAVRVLDTDEYPTYGKALWFTLQTVTTVGYGDATPAEPIGKIVAAIVMLSSIALITVITAAVTSTFVAAAQRRRAVDRPDVDRDELRASLAELATRLERIEGALDVDPSAPSGQDVPASQQPAVRSPGTAS